MKPSPNDFIRREVALAKGLVDFNRKSEQILSEVRSFRASVEDHKAQVSRILNLPAGPRGEKGERGPRGLDGKDGAKGKDGADGFTPTKGKDYFTKLDKEELTLGVLARIRTPKDGENAIVDEKKIANSVIELIREKQLLTTDNISGLRNELTSYRSQLALKQAGQHGGGDTVVAGTGITLTRLPNGTTQIDATGGGTGTVTSVSVVSANGFAGSVANATTTPAITLTTTVTGLLKGNGTAISQAVANTDYQAPITLTTTGSSGAATFDGTTLNIPQYSAGSGGQVNTVVGTADRITVNSTDPVNPVVDIASTYVGQTSITTLGTIATGTWNATAIALNKITALTASRAVVSDGSGFLSASATTSTEIGYVSGVTSAIQTQLNAKQATITFGTGVQTALGVNIGSAGAPVLFNGALGTPSSGTVTNLTGTASININGTVGATTPTTGVFTTATANTEVVSPKVRASASGGLILEANNATDIGLLGAGNTANVTWYGSHNFDLATQDTIAAFTGAGKTLGSLALATYPSLTELSYVKGVTSAIQTQLNAKAPTASPTLTGTTTVDRIDYDRAIGVVSAIGNLGSTETFDWATATNFTGTLDADTTLDFSNAVSGQTISLFLLYSGAQRTIAWSQTIEWGGSAAPTGPDASGETLVVTLKYIGSTYFGSFEIFS